MKFKSFMFMLVLATGLVFSGFAQAQQSAGCQNLNDPGQDGLYTFNSGSLALNALEVLVVSANTPSFGTPTGIELKIDTVLVDSDGFPGTVSYQFPTTDTFFISWEVLGDASATWTVSCTPAPAAPATPIPTLNWQGIAVLVTLMAGFAYYRRRKIVVG